MSSASLLGSREQASRAMLLGSAGTASLTVAALALNLLTVVVLTRILGASGYGTYAFALAWASVLGVAALPGLAPLVVRNVVTYRSDGAWGQLRGMLRRANQAALVAFGLVVAGAAAAAAIVPSARPSAAPAVWLALLLVPIIGLTSARQAAMRGLDRVVASRVPELLAQPVVFLALILAVYGLADLDGEVAVGLHVASAGVALLLGAGLLRRVLPLQTRRIRAVYESGTWARAALPLLLISGVAVFNDRIGVILLGAIEDETAAGLFAAAERAAAFVGFFLLVAAQPLAPVITRLWASGARAELQRIVTLTTRGVFAGALRRGRSPGYPDNPELFEGLNRQGPAVAGRCPIFGSPTPSTPIGGKE